MRSSQTLSSSVPSPRPELEWGRGRPSIGRCMRRVIRCPSANRRDGGSRRMRNRGPSCSCLAWARPHHQTRPLGVGWVASCSWSPLGYRYARLRGFSDTPRVPPVPERGTPRGGSVLLHPRGWEHLYAGVHRCATHRVGSPLRLRRPHPRRRVPLTCLPGCLAGCRPPPASWTSCLGEEHGHGRRLLGSGRGRPQKAGRRRVTGRPAWWATGPGGARGTRRRASGARRS